MNDSLVNCCKRMGAFLLAALLAAPLFLNGAEQGKEKKGGAEEAKNEQQRTEAIKKVCRALGIGPGDAIADIGCGGGVDTVTFAGVVGPAGKVYAEEIAPGALTNPPTLRRWPGRSACWSPSPDSMVTTGVPRSLPPPCAMPAWK